MVRSRVPDMGGETISISALSTLPRKKTPWSNRYYYYARLVAETEQVGRSEHEKASRHQI